jgi:uncharacterized protein (TIGR00369 family)
MQVPPNCDLTLGLVCVDKSEPGRTVWQMKADERFANPAGVVQGGFLGALCDSAMGASAVTYARRDGERRVFSANAEMKTSFVRPVRPGALLTCLATVVSGGDRVVFCEAEVRDEQGQLVAKATSTYVVTPRG